MQRLLAVLVALGGAVLAAGCSSSPVAPPSVVAAPPQAVELAWDERSPATGQERLVFRVRRFAVTAAGWETDVEVENRTGVAWVLGEDPVAVDQSFGIMLFATRSLAEVERRNRDGDLPGLRAAQSFEPPLAARLAPGASWRGTVSARGSLAAGRFVRVVFGPLVAVETPPSGMPAHFVWITDHAYRLRARP